jgi:hypothetical protein
MLPLGADNVMTESRVFLRRGIPAALKRFLFERSGNECAFPGCRTLLITSEGSFIGQICHIEHKSEWNPRFNPHRQAAEFDRPDNFIVLCPTHHILVDTDASLYSSDWLRKAWTDHTQRVASSAAKAALSRDEVKNLGTVSFPKALEYGRPTRQTTMRNSGSNSLDISTQTEID